MVRHGMVRNDRGEDVDPVPFLVVFLIALLVCYSFGPPYLMALGVSLPWAVGFSTAVFAVLAGVAYYRMVWRARTAMRGEVPGEVRFRRLVWVVFVLVALAVLLALPLLVVTHPG